jgi:transposase-like protein
VIVSSLETSSAPAGYRFPPDVIAVAVRWYLRYGLSYRDVEELLTERGIEVDHVSVYRWVQTFTAQFIDAAGAARHGIGSRWFLDETYVKIAGHWQYLYRGVDQHGHFIDVLVSPRRNAAAPRVFLHDRTARWANAERDHHRQGTGLPTRRRRPRSRGATRNRPLCQQQD